MLETIMPKLLAKSFATAWVAALTKLTPEQVEQLLKDSTNPKEPNMETEYEYEVRFTRVGDRKETRRLFTSENEAVAFRDGLDITGPHGVSIQQIPKPWTPKAGETVWYVDTETNTCQQATWPASDAFASARVKINNLFRTCAEAEAALAVCVEALKRHKEGKQGEGVRKSRREIFRGEAVKRWGASKGPFTVSKWSLHSKEGACLLNISSDEAVNLVEFLNKIAP